MTPRINSRDKVIVVGDRGWHDLGVKMEAISIADLSEQFPYSYEKVQMFTGDGVEVDNCKAIITTDDGRTCGIVGDGYEIINIDDMIALASDLVASCGSAAIVSAGSVHNRQDIFIDIELDREFRNGDDVWKPFIGLTNNCCGVRHATAGAHLNRMVCGNMLNLRLSEIKNAPRALKIRHTFRHTWGKRSRLAEAGRILGITSASFDTADAEMQAMSAKAMTRLEIVGYYDSIMPIAPLPVRVSDENAEQYEAKIDTIERANRKASKIRGEWCKTFDDERDRLRQEPNLWLALNSVTKWVQHSNQVKGVATDPLMRGWSNRFATGFKLTNEAHDNALSILVA